jgi:hypothetical protein
VNKIITGEIKIMKGLLQGLRWANIVVGGALIIVGIGASLWAGRWIPFLLALAVIIVGPLEDLLIKYLRLPGVDPESTKTLVDQTTSLLFLLLLFAALFISL